MTGTKEGVLRTGKWLSIAGIVSIVIWGYYVVLSHKPEPIEYRVVCAMPALNGDTPTTRFILHDIQTRDRETADVIGSDGSYRPMLGELCFHMRSPEPTK